MAKILFLLVFGLGALVLHVNTLRVGALPEILHANYEHHGIRRPQIISRERDENNFDEPKVASSHLHRLRRDTTTTTNVDPNKPDIKPKINYLNDTHAQLMVHWLGEGTKVMICLARDFPTQNEEITKRQLSPSAVYFSYDYGDSFINKTDLFKVLVNGTLRPSTLDQFSTHPKYDTIIFTDSKNKAIFNVQNKGTGPFQRFMVDFTPSDISFYENHADTYLVLDKEDPERKLYITIDGGVSFTLLQLYVKAFIWSSGDDDLPTHLYVERKEPTGTSSVIFYNASTLVKNPKANTYHKLIDNIQDFQIKKDFMIGVRKVANTTQVLVSYKRGSFIKTQIQTVQEMKGIHICDVEGRRIMMAIAHSETSANLYVSESNPNMTVIKFVPSLENIFTFIPKVTWKNGWIASSTTEPFTDLYKVEGITGIYIASKISRPPIDAVGPEHLKSVITFDHGGYWQPIKAPEVDDENQSINCSNCSLHVSQKFSNLYPVTRSVQMMSSKLAPGIVMASGVIGTSLKGYPGVFLSRDGGMSWKQVLKSYHFFNFGDHGGVLVAVKYFKTKGETRNILFSTDEGVTWRNQSFHDNDLKIYGLMTEPNSNQTIFTLFGSELKEHRWLIVKVDLINAFARNCTENDYKFWAPSSKSGESLKPCILGTQQAFHRRNHDTNCYNGAKYDSYVRTEVCVCTQWDFECDFGFTRQGSGTNSHCIFNKSMEPLVKPYKVPDDCRPGQFYNRTRGYRRIEGDVCIGGFEYRYLPQTIPCPLKEETSFLLVAQRHKISRVDLISNKQDVLPVQNLKNVIAIDFDLKNNCVFFADIMSDVIGRQCLNGNQSVEILVDRDLASVEGMSYDWISEMLFYVDGTKSLIEAVVTKPGNMYKSRVTIINKDQDLLKPRGIVVHPTEGYIFWTEWSSQKPALSRANLDGSDRRILFSKPDVVWPNGITIDHVAQRIYWVDANKDYIASSDLNGHNKITIVQQDARVDHPFAVAVFKDQIYWDDWKMNSIFEANKDHGIMIHAIQEHMENLMDLKVFAHSVQEGSNACEKSNCSHICVGAPRGEFSCLCPNGMVKSNNTNECVCPGGQKAFANLTCPSAHSTCSPEYFSCEKSPGICIPKVFQCDGEHDCEDKSDEKDCPVINAENPCQPNHFLCPTNKKCIPQQFVCDMESDCQDGADEKNCTLDKCKEEEFKCTNGNCISMRWKCDGENDCNDNSDEKDCPSKSSRPAGNGTIVCKINEYKCKSTDQCISNDWICDKDHDCADGSDEMDCKKRECDTWEKSCGDGKCIYKTWWCDGDTDCDGGVDEKDCATKPPKSAVTPPTDGTFFPSVVCHDWMFKCANNKCIPTWWKCDKVNDCGDNSDEQGCSNNSQEKDVNVIDSTTKSTVKPSGSNCPANQFECNSGGCIKKSYVCDGQDDCDEGEDEKNCSPKEDICEATKNFRCKSDRKCLPLSKSCNGIRDCADGSDEDNCKHYKPLKPEANATCEPGNFACDNICHPLYERCDEKPNCNDRTDEENCSSVQRVYQVTYMSVVEPTNPTSFLLAWEVANLHLSDPTNQVHLEYLPSIAVVGDKWRNHTNWISDLKFLYKGLVPKTHYNLTVYTRIKGKNESEAHPYLYTNTVTAAAVPNKPINPKVRQLNGTRVQVTWDAPEDSHGNVKYTVFYRPQSYSAGGVINQRVKTDATNTIIDYDFKGNETYEFWIRANNNVQESPVSQMIKLTFNDSINIDLIEDIKINLDKEKDELKLSWKKSAAADGYYVEVSLPEPYPNYDLKKIKDPQIVFKSMPRSVQITFKISAYVSGYNGKTHTNFTTIPGEPLPQVNNIQLQQNPDIVSVQWSVPKTNMKNLTYAVYYGTSVSELFEKPRYKTQKISAEIKDMLPCENYFVSVGIWGPIGPGPLSHNPKSIETEPNDKKPPRNLKANVDPKSRYMLISWEHNCPSAHKYPSYVVKITELATNKDTVIQLNRSLNKTMTHYIEDIPLGSSYNVSVKSGLIGSEESVVKVKAPPLQGPRQLRVWWEQNKSVAVFWKEIENPNYNFNYTYEIVIYKGLLSGDVSEEGKIHKVIAAASPPISIAGQHFINTDPDFDNTFTIGVRVKDVKYGYISEISEVEHIEVRPEYLASGIERRSSVAIPLILTMIVLCIVGGVGYFLFQKRRRQQASFSRFANSHYDTKTGATRIGDSLDDEETMHQVHERNQHRFAVDEPLVT